MKVKATQYPETPEIDRMKAIQEESQSIGAFIDWLDENGMPICKWTEYDDAHPQYNPIHLSIEKLLAKYFEIDLDKLENEKQAILDTLRG